MEYKHFLTSQGELRHYGIKGMKWGVRRYQNYDGSLTTKGKERYHNTKSGMSRFAGMLDPGLAYASYYQPDTYKEVIYKPNEENNYEWWTPLHDDIRESRRNQDYLDNPDSAMEKHASKINSGYGTESGTFSNCGKVSAVNCLAMMGWDFDAGRALTGERDSMSYWFDNVEKTLADNVDEAIAQKLSRTDAGSFGTIDLRRGDGPGGHMFNWQRKSDGSFSLIDGQPSGAAEVYNGSSPKDCIDQYLEKRPWFSADATVCVHDMTYASPNFNNMEEDSVCRITDDSEYMSGILDTNTNRIYKDL